MPSTTLMLPTNPHILINTDDFNALVSAGYSPKFCFKSNGQTRYVRTREPDGKVCYVARAILGNPAGTVIHRNGIRTDLRRENLTVSAGWFADDMVNA